MRRLRRRLARADDLDRRAAAFLEFAQETTELARRQPITCRMREHGDAAARMYPTDRLFERRPLTGDVRQATAPEILLERLPHRRHIALLYQKAREVRARNYGPARQQARLF